MGRSRPEWQIWYRVKRDTERRWFYLEGADSEKQRDRRLKTLLERSRGNVEYKPMRRGLHPGDS